MADASALARLWTASSPSVDGFRDSVSAGHLFLHLPDFALVETTQVFWKQVRFGGWSRAQARQAVADIRALPGVRHMADALVEDALVQALDHGLSAYDATYLALAARLGSFLVTADRKLAGVAAARVRAVVLLQDA